MAHTDFLTPPARADAMIALNRLSDVGCMTSGGFPQVPSLPFPLQPEGVVRQDTVVWG